MQRRRFFNWVQTSVRLWVSGSKKLLGKIGLILKLRNVKSLHNFFFRKLFEKMRKIDLANSIFINSLFKKFLNSRPI